MKKTKTINEQITELLEENETLQVFKKNFNNECKTIFGYDVSKIKKMIDKQIAYEQRMAERQGQRNQIQQGWILISARGEAPGAFAEQKRALVGTERRAKVP